MFFSFLLRANLAQISYIKSVIKIFNFNLPFQK